MLAKEDFLSHSMYLNEKSLASRLPLVLPVCDLGPSLLFSINRARGSHSSGHSVIQQTATEFFLCQTVAQTLEEKKWGTKYCPGLHGICSLE